MKQEKRVPKRRFRAFAEAGEWNEAKLGDVATFAKGIGYSKDDLVPKGTPVILYGRMYTNYVTVIDAVDTYVEPLHGSIYSTGREVIVPASGETAEDISIASAVRQPDVLLGGDLNVISPDDAYNPTFLALFLSRGKAKQELSRKAQGKTVVHLHGGDLSDVDVVAPALKEQQQIGTFCCKLDDLITSHERKFQKLEHLKQAYLAEMFPAKGERQPRRRFEGFSGDWEGKTLGDLLAFSNGFNGSREMYGHGIKYISVMDILNNDYIVYDNIRGQVDVSEETAKAFAVTYGDVLFQRSSETFDEAGTSNVYVDADRPAVFGGFVICGTKVDEYDPFFMKHLLDTKPVRHQIISTAQGAQHINVGQESLSHVQIFLPNMDEQQKIGAFFRIMDKKLQSEHQKLAKLRALKQAYLSELFV